MTAQGKASLNSFNCRKTLTAAGKTYTYYSLPDAAANGLGDISRLPYSLKVLLENLSAQRGRPLGHQGRYHRNREVDRNQRQGKYRDRLSSGPRLDAGLYGRAGRG